MVNKPEPPPESDPRAIARRVATATDCDVILYCGGINGSGEEAVRTAVPKDGARRPNVHLLLTTYGGSAESAFRIARSLRRKYAKGKLTVVVDSYCKSAGTLLAVGANEIVMSDLAELGPLDVQLRKPDEIAERQSGLTSFEALRTLQDRAYADFQEFMLRLRLGTKGQISTKTAADVASKLVTGLYQPVYAQIDPIRVAEDARAMAVAEQYGRLLQTSNVKPGTLDRLLREYPDHGFVLDREQATKLFESVRVPSPDEAALLDHIHELVESRAGSEEPFVSNLSAPPSGDGSTKVHPVPSESTNGTSRVGTQPSPDAAADAPPRGHAIVPAPEAACGH